MVSNSRSVPSSPKKLSQAQPAHRSPRKLNFVVPSSVNSCAVSQSLDKREENNQLSCHSIVKRRRTTRRALFGRPQVADTNQWLSDLENSLMDEKVEKWGFDFRNDRPIDEPCSSSAVLPPSSMVYEPMEQNHVPHFYRSKTLCNESPKKGQRLPNLPQTFDKDHLQHHTKNEANLRHNNGHMSSEAVFSFGRLNHAQSPTKLRKLTSPVVHKTPGKKESN